MTTGLPRPQGAPSPMTAPNHGRRPARSSAADIARSFQLPQLFTSTRGGEAALAIARAGIWRPSRRCCARLREERAELLARFGLAPWPRSARRADEGTRKLADIAMAVREAAPADDGEPPAASPRPRRWSGRDPGARAARRRVHRGLRPSQRHGVARFADRVAVWSQGGCRARPPAQCWRTPLCSATSSASRPPPGAGWPRCLSCNPSSSTSPRARAARRLPRDAARRRVA